MQLPSRFLGSRVAARLFWLFVVAALLPLALSDWIAATAVTDLARDIQQEGQTRATRQVGMQVFDRLATAKSLLASLPEISQTTQKDTAAIKLPPASQRMFSRLVHVDAQGHPDWPQGSGDGLLVDWHASDHGSDGPAPLPLAADPGSVQAIVRILARSDQPTRLLMASISGGRLVWIGEVQPAYLWEPVENAAIDSDWRVVDGRGRSLVVKGDVPLLPAAQGNVAGASADVLQVRTSMFLGAEFGAGAWDFIEQRAAPQARWRGLSLVGWLSLVAAATLLLIALISQRAIRRMLIPLEQLTAGTRHLADGDSATRVSVRSGDEFGTLGVAFNEMASRIEAQFGSLNALSAVDRDVLAGVPIEHVVSRVLDQLGRLYPTLVATVSWRPLDRADILMQLIRCRDEAVRTPPAEHRLSVDQADAFAAVGADQRLTGAAMGIDRPWCSGVAMADTVALVLMPLCWGNGTQAMLVIGLPGGSEGIDLNAAIELRDRLAVAFSAREREREMIHRAVHDSLTGLANRSGLSEFVARLLDGHVAGSSHAAMFVDIDHFKDINDSLGHNAGDAILCEAADRLRTCVASGALLARQGGDEFVLVLPCTDESQARVSAQRVVEELSRPFQLGGETHQLGASVGVAMYPAHGADGSELLRHADLAMYAAKQAGRGRYEIFSETLEAAAHERLRIPRELRRDMDLGKLVAYYQARVDPLDGRVLSCEALVRWQHPERGLVFPDAFISLAEESSLIEDLGNWMINESCARMSLWRESHPGLQRVSVNVSSRQLVSGKLPDVVRTALQRHGLPPDRLELEVTESLLVEDSKETYAQLAELRAMGVRIALDDFGTGFSSMAMLRKLPIDVIKIDRAFVKDLDTDEGALAITRSIAELAHSLGLHLVAEGIENDAQADMLRNLRCDEFQGYLYSKPLPPAEFSMLCAAREKGTRQAPDVQQVAINIHELS